MFITNCLLSKALGTPKRIAPIISGSSKSSSLFRRAGPTTLSFRVRDEDRNARHTEAHDHSLPLLCHRVGPSSNSVPIVSATCKANSINQGRFNTFHRLYHVPKSGMSNFGSNYTVRPSVILPASDYMYLLTAIGLSPGGSSTVHIYTQTIHRTFGVCHPDVFWHM
jgi:hypothetical protein